MKIYIDGKITGLKNYKELFKKAEERLIKKGNSIMNPSVLPDGFEHHEYMRVCYAMIDVCEVIYFLNNWRDSRGANMEYEYALKNGKFVMFEGD